MPSIKTSLYLAAFTLLLTSTSPAVVNLTLDRNTGAWSFNSTSNLDVRRSLFLGIDDAFWADLSATGGASSSASFSYSGNYNGSAVSGVGTAIFETISTSDLPRTFRLNFGSTTLGGAGTFTSFSLVPTSNLTNPTHYSTALSGPLQALAPNTNEALTVTVVPEPGSHLLLIVAATALILRRRSRS